MLRYMAALVHRGLEKLMAPQGWSPKEVSRSAALTRASNRETHSEILTEVWDPETRGGVNGSGGWPPQRQCIGGAFHPHNTNHLKWVQLECSLYAANVVVGRWVSESHPQQAKHSPLTGTAGSEPEKGVEASIADGSWNAAKPIGGGHDDGFRAGSTGGPSLAQSPTPQSTIRSGVDSGLDESALAEVRVGEGSLTEVDEAVRELVLAAVAGAVLENGETRVLSRSSSLSLFCFATYIFASALPNPPTRAAFAGSLKLAGTALTLIGGLARWFVRAEASHPSLIRDALSAILKSIQSPDIKLSRNAATTLQVRGSFIQGRIHCSANEFSTGSPFEALSST